DEARIAAELSERLQKVLGERLGLGRSTRAARDGDGPQRRIEASAGERLFDSVGDGFVNRHSGREATASLQLLRRGADAGCGAASEVWHHVLAEALRLLEVRVAGEDERVDPQVDVLLEATRHALT